MKTRTYKMYSATVLLMIFLIAATLLPTATLAASPAQDGAVDPAVIDAIRAASVLVAQAAGVGAPGATAVENPPLEPPTVTITSTLPTTSTLPITPTAPTTPTAVVIPTTDDFDEYTSNGVSILAPTQWHVETDTGGAIFSMADDAAGLEVQMQDFGDEFPGLIVFPIFEANAQALIESFATDGVVTDVSRIEVEQGIPALRIGFSGGIDDGEQKGGVIYIYATGSSALGLLGGAAIENWPDLEPVVDEIAGSVILDDDMINLEIAGSDGLAFDDPQGEFSLTIPAGWYVSPMQDSDLRLVIADPDVKTVGAMAVAVDIAGGDEQLKAFTEAMAGALSGEDAQKFADEFVQMLDLGASDMIIDAAQTGVLPSQGDAAGIVRLVGTAPIEDGPTMDMSIYSAVYADKVVALVVFGAPSDVQAEEETIVGILDGVQFP